MRKKSLLTVAIGAAALASLSAGPAFAGEVTGSGANVDQNQGRSWCSFSGLNDNPGNPLTDPDDPGGHSQSYGQLVKLGHRDPHVANPGVFCNPNKSPLPDFPNRP